MNPLEPWLPETIYLVIKSLLSKGVFSPNRETVEIERVDRNPIYPCGISHGPEGLDLSQLEWAVREGDFWFLGPIKALNIIIDKGPIQGDLKIGINRTMFTTSLNTLNYNNFEVVAQKLRELTQQLGLEIGFQQSTGIYNVTLVVSSETLLSVDNVNNFLEKLHILHKSTDRL